MSQGGINKIRGGGGLQLYLNRRLGGLRGFKWSHDAEGDGKYAEVHQDLWGRSVQPQSVNICDVSK